MCVCVCVSVSVSACVCVSMRACVRAPVRVRKAVTMLHTLLGKVIDHEEELRWPNDPQRTAGGQVVPGSILARTEHRTEHLVPRTKLTTYRTRVLLAAHVTDPWAVEHGRRVQDISPAPWQHRC